MCKVLFIVSIGYVNVSLSAAGYIKLKYRNNASFKASASE